MLPPFPFFSVLDAGGELPRVRVARAQPLVLVLACVRGAYDAEGGSNGREVPGRRRGVIMRRQEHAQARSAAGATGGRQLQG